MVRRNRLAVTATAAVALALAVGIAVSTTQAIRARQAEALAGASAAEARTQADRADQTAQAATRIAEENRQRLARLTVDNGVRLMDEGHALLALRWWVEALRLDAGSAEREQAHRIRIDSVLRHSPRLMHLLAPQSGFADYAEFSPDGSKVVTVGSSGTSRIGFVQVWDLVSGDSLIPPIVHSNRLVLASFSHDGRGIVTACLDGTARVWSAESGGPITPPLVLGSFVTHAEFSSDGLRLVTGHSNGQAQVWDAVTGQALGNPMPHEDQVTVAAFCPDGRQIVTSTRYATRLWSVASSAVALRPIAVVHSLTDAWRPWRSYPVFSADGTLLLTPSAGESVRVYDVQTLTPASPHLPHNGEVYHAAFSPDARRAVTASKDGTTRVWDLGSGSRAPNAIASSPLINRVPTSRDGNP